MFDCRRKTTTVGRPLERLCSSNDPNGVTLKDIESAGVALHLLEIKNLKFKGKREKFIVLLEELCFLITVDSVARQNEGHFFLLAPFLSVMWNWLETIDRDSLCTGI